MSRVWSLYKSLLNVQFGWSAAKYNYIKKRQRLWEPVIIVLGLGPALGMIVFGLWRFAEIGFETGLMLGQPHIVLALAAAAAQIITLFFGFFYVLSSFYFSDDLKMLIPLPYRSWEVLAAKLLAIMTGQYLSISVIVLPIWINYGRLARAGIPYWITSVLVFLALPVLPLVIASLLAILLMRVANVSNKKDLVTMIGGILILVVVIGSQLYLQTKMPDADPEELLLQLMSEADGLVKAVGRVFPPSVWAANGMAYAHKPYGWWNLVLFLGITAVGGLVLYGISERVFYQGLIAGMDGGKTRSRKKVEVSSTAYERPVIWSAALSEMKLFLRNPGYVLNGLVGYILFPLFALIPLLTQGNLEVNPLQALFEEPIPVYLVMGGVALFFLVMTALSSIPATTFSREGKYLWIRRTLPVSIQQVLAGKILGAQIINVIGCVVALVPITYILRLNIGGVVGGCIIGILLSTGMSGLLALLDLARPMLDWVDPIKAMKSNLNGVIALLVVGLAAFGIGYRMFVHYQRSTMARIPVELLVLAAVLFAVYKYLGTKFAEYRWMNLEGGIL